MSEPRTTVSIKPGDRVYHKRAPEMTGTIMSVDSECYPAHEYGVTTCVVEWDDGYCSDIQWTNKLEVIQ